MGEERDRLSRRRGDRDSYREQCLRMPDELKNARGKFCGEEGGEN